ncbi:hypothetical protein Tco_0807557 [Tanacetum coccineum]
MERGFLSQKGDGGRRGVKEKNGVAPSAKEKNEAVKDGVAPSITVASGNNIGTQEVNSVKASHDNLHGENVGETPINFTANPNKGTSYANLFFGESIRKSVNFRTLITPVGNGIDVDVLVESIRAISERFVNTTYGFFLGKRVAYPGRSNYARAMIKLRADVELKDTIVVAMPKLVGEGFYTYIICTDVAKKSKIPSQAPRGVPVGPKGKPLKRVDYSSDHDSEDEVALVDIEMANFLALERVGYGINSLLEQWRETYENADYDYDPYDNDMYEGQKITYDIQSICDNLDIKLQGRKKK